VCDFAWIQKSAGENGDKSSEKIFYLQGPLKSKDLHLGFGLKHPAGPETVLVKISARQPLLSLEKWEIWTSKFGCFLGKWCFRHSKT